MLPPIDCPVNKVGNSTVSIITPHCIGSIACLVSGRHVAKSPTAKSSTENSNGKDWIREWMEDEVPWSSRSENCASWNGVVSVDESVLYLEDTFLIVGIDFLGSEGRSRAFSKSSSQEHVYFVDLVILRIENMRKIHILYKLSKPQGWMVCINRLNEMQ